jgi:hypothetical protein
MATANRSGGDAGTARGGQTDGERMTAAGEWPGDDEDATWEAEGSASPWERMLEALDADDDHDDAWRGEERRRGRRRM